MAVFAANLNHRWLHVKHQNINTACWLMSAVETRLASSQKRVRTETVPDVRGFQNGRRDAWVNDDGACWISVRDSAEPAGLAYVIWAAADGSLGEGC
ncbi:hypothetical protein SKAU_G00053780 [Synaphobranchus kaupii]|uniref:Uncharacterized protein n=1 Tax=Synaphobranchus kaupii TaxID=118154 RepID=A0A9Q1G3G9_SYNKA|nr:hypothetical protein SKAU_G00053780 [Synaphobranchus kaupii]